jgi:hypothetical protein
VLGFAVPVEVAEIDGALRIVQAEGAETRGQRLVPESRTLASSGSGLTKPHNIQ